MPGEDVDELEVSQPGFLAAQLDLISEGINDRLRKRYAVPFVAPVPKKILDWTQLIVTPRAYFKRGTNPSDQQIQKAWDWASEAEKQIDAAADAVNGMFELPLRQDSTASGVSKGGPFAHSEASPYVWADAQRETARGEDNS